MADQEEDDFAVLRKAVGDSKSGNKALRRIEETLAQLRQEQNAANRKIFGLHDGMDCVGRQYYAMMDARTAEIERLETRMEVMARMNNAFVVLLEEAQQTITNGEVV